MAEFDDKEVVSEEIDMAALRARLEATAEDPELPDDLKAMYSNMDALTGEAQRTVDAWDKNGEEIDRLMKLSNEKIMERLDYGNQRLALFFEAAKGNAAAEALIPKDPDLNAAAAEWEKFNKEVDETHKAFEDTLEANSVEAIKNSAEYIELTGKIEEVKAALVTIEAKTKELMDEL